MLALMSGSLTDGQRTRTSFTIPRGLEPEFEEALRSGDQKRINAVLAKIPWANALTGRLYSSISKGDVGRVKELLTKGADPNANNANDWRPLISLGGTDAQAFQIARLLVQYGAKVNYQQPDQGWTPLISACSGHPGGLPLVKYLLDKGARLDLALEMGDTALHMAVRFQKTEIVRELLRRGAPKEARTHEQEKKDPKWSFYLPANEGFIKRAEREQAARLEVNFEPGYRFAGKTPLFEAGTNGNLEILKILVAAGSNAKAKDANDWTLLHEASHWQGPKVLAYLLTLGLDPNAASKAGFRPLHLAARSLSLDSVRLLIENGADTHARNNANQTPLDLLLSDEKRRSKEGTAVPEDPVFRSYYERLRKTGQGIKKLLSG